MFKKLCSTFIACVQVLNEARALQHTLMHEYRNPNTKENTK